MVNLTRESEELNILGANELTPKKLWTKFFPEGQKAQNTEKLVNLTRESEELNISGETKLTPRKNSGQIFS